MLEENLKKWIETEHKELKERLANSKHQGEVNYLTGRLDSLEEMEDFLSKINHDA